LDGYKNGQAVFIRKLPVRFWCNISLCPPVVIIRFLHEMSEISFKSCEMKNMQNEKNILTKEALERMHKKAGDLYNKGIMASYICHKLSTKKKRLFLRKNKLYTKLSTLSTGK